MDGNNVTPTPLCRAIKSPQCAECEGNHDIQSNDTALLIDAINSLTAMVSEVSDKLDAFVGEDEEDDEEEVVSEPSAQGSGFQETAEDIQQGMQ